LLWLFLGNDKELQKAILETLIKEVEKWKC
jgi:hypothetical protein